MSHPQPQQGKLTTTQRRRHKLQKTYLKRKRDQRTTSQETSKRARTAPPAKNSSKQKATKHTISHLNRDPKKVKDASNTDEEPTELDTSNNPDSPSSSSITGSMRVHGRTPSPTTSPLHTLSYGSLHPGTTTLAIGLGADAGERKEHVRSICDMLKGMERREGLKGTVLRPESFLAVRFGSVAERDLAGRMMGDSLLGSGPVGPCNAVGASNAAADGALGKLKEVSDVIQGLVDEVAALRSMLLAYGMEPGKMKEVLELVMAGVKPDLAIFI